jgi:EAL domain-containing protein (putative c-di-GMP-specific phosphodiesterase class I)
VRERTPSTVTDVEDSANLRAEWMQYRARLFDRDIGLPTLPNVVDDIRRQLEDGVSVALFTFMLNAERQVEEIWGWQAYDRLISDFVKALRNLSEKGVVPPGILCVPAVRSDEILSFIPLPNGSGESGPTMELLSRLNQDFESFVRGFLMGRLNTIDRFSSHVGQALILFDPKVRVERVVYRGLREARGQVYRSTATAEEHGAEVLKTILARRDVVSVFQPIYDLVERKVAALEALTRGPAGSGLEDAESLFSLAERANLVIPLERLCRRRSLEEAGKAKWQHLVFINLSPAAAQDSEFLEGMLLRDCIELSLDPHRIVIEITERTYAQYQELFSKVIAELRHEGFRVAVDDLGSGYSNLSSLAEIKPEFLKFDHHFTKDIDRHRIKQDLLGAILTFAVNSNTQVIAEGIETEEEFEALRRLGVPLGQGYYLARPGAIGTFAG